MIKGAKQLVLVVEDDDIDADYILRALAKLDITTEIFPRSYDAIAYLQQSDAPKPDLILLDWKIAGGGSSMLRAVREDSRIATVPVIVLSRSTASTDVRAAYEGLANAFVAKASELSDLLAQVEFACEFFLKIAQQPKLCSEDTSDVLLDGVGRYEHCVSA